MKITTNSENIYNKKGGENKMKNSRIKIIVGVAVSTLVAAAFIANTSTAEDVRSSKHNLSTNPNVDAEGTSEVCVFCHTPHGGATDVAGGAAPLWNRNLSTATYTLYTSPNFDAINQVQPAGVSQACLSCHDGTVAFDSLLNFPGSGSTDGITFIGTNNVDAQGKMKNNAALHSGEFPMLGNDLSNDHPITMEIPCAVGPLANGSGDRQFDGICTNLNSTELGAGRVSLLTRDPATYPVPTDKRNAIRAYPTVSGKAYIECASCHNPHIGTTESTRFLRLPSWNSADAAYSATDRNAGSLICLSCHEK